MRTNNRPLLRKQIYYFGVTDWRWTKRIFD